MKVIFLDIDGVMNNIFSLHRSRFYLDFEIINDDNEVESVTDDFCWVSMRVLNNIIESTEAKVVLSSTWRLFHSKNEMNQILKHYGFKGELIDFTPKLPYDKVNNKYPERGLEIQKWLDECESNIENFVILDDDSDMAHLIDKLIKTDCHFGLNHTHEELVIQMLNK